MATSLIPPTAQQPIVGPDGRATRSWSAWFRDVAKTIADFATTFVTTTLSATTVNVSGDLTLTAQSPSVTSYQLSAENIGDPQTDDRLVFVPTSGSRGRYWFDSYAESAAGTVLSVATGGTERSAYGYAGSANQVFSYGADWILSTGTALESPVVHERLRVATDGTTTVSPLAGTGTRPVMASATGELSAVAPAYGEIYEYENSTAITISAANEYFALTLLNAGTMAGFTAVTGLIASITGVTDAGVGGLVTVAATGTWVAGTCVTLHGTTDYDGRYVIVTGGTNVFRVVATYTTTRTGTARRAAALVAGASAAGVYRVSMSASVQSAANNITFHMEPIVGTEEVDNAAGEAATSAGSWTRAIAGSGFVTIAAGDCVWAAIQNDTSATNLTVKYCNLNLVRVAV